MKSTLEGTMYSNWNLVLQASGKWMYELSFSATFFQNVNLSTNSLKEFLMKFSSTDGISICFLNDIFYSL